MVPHLSAADSARERGNKAFGNSDYAAAIENYTNALNQYDVNEVEARVKAHTNRAMAYDKIGSTAMAIADYDAALALNSTSTKALYRRMFLREKQQAWAGVISDGEALLAADSGLTQSEKTQLAALMKKAEAAQRADAAQSLGPDTNSDESTSSPSSSRNDDNGPSDGDGDEQSGTIDEITTHVHKLSFSPGSDNSHSVHPALAVAAAHNNNDVINNNSSPDSPRTDEETLSVAHSNNNGNHTRGSGSNGSSRGPGAGLCGACGKDAKSLCRRCNHTVYCGRSCQQAHWKFHKAFCTLSAQDPSPQLTVLSRRGLAGLFNAGNSCYLNSAVACLSHCYPLTQHLISGRYTAELNPTNALGKFPFLLHKPYRRRPSFAILIFS